jgi:hypothetical protein
MKIFKRVLIVLILILLVWFIGFRTKELVITYDGVEEELSTASFGTFGGGLKSAKMAARSTAAPLAAANMMSNDALYDTALVAETAVEGSAESEERYRENRFFRVDTESFESLVKDLDDKIKELKGTIKINDQNSNRRKEYGMEFYPRFQNIEFTIDNQTKDLESIEEIFKKYGNIRISNSNKSSIEQELTNYEQQLKEMEEARKALQESKDKDWIARRDSELAKQSERIKNQIENAKKQSTYITYTINVYEVIKFRVNALKYWYTNNYALQNAINDAIPNMIKVFAVLTPIVVMTLILLLAVLAILRNARNKAFEDKLKAIEKMDAREIHFDVKL